MHMRDDLNFEEFKTLLLQQQEQVKSNIQSISKELDEVCSDDDINDVEDLAALNILSKKDNTFLHQQEHVLKEIAHALQKIEHGTYGICEISDAPIPYERLLANPIARCTTLCQKRAEG